MTPDHISAFSRGPVGGNGAGVVIQDKLPSAEAMQALAKELNYSETVFAEPKGDGWHVRYFAPEVEVPFCGHATIALGAGLGARFGEGRYTLHLQNGDISVTALKTAEGWSAALQSPPTHSKPLDETRLREVMELLSLTPDDLDPAIPPTLANGGVNHIVLALKSRETLAAMAYDFDAMRDFMEREHLITILLVHVESDTLFNVRNAFAIGGVVEDAATGAAAAAFAGALVDQDWPALKGGGTFTIHQGDDMGQPSTLNVTVTGIAGDSVTVQGATRLLK